MLSKGIRKRSIDFYKKFFSSYNFDLFVIGGGSGGLSAAKEAAKLKKKVGLADYVSPSPKGASWGVGGTCVNVGCIPKKMMHHAGNLYLGIKDYKFVGLKDKISNPHHDWNTLIENVQNHIKSLNFGYQSQLLENNITYYNKFAKFLDKNTLELTTNDKKEREVVTAKNIIIATGGRPKYSGVPGEKELCITSDDLFSLRNPPGKTLIIGASYIALECGGILRSLGYDTTIMVRSILLRGFDQKIAQKIGSNLAKIGVKFIQSSIPICFQKNGNKILVEYKDLKTKQKKKLDDFDTVLVAIGRTPNTSKLNLGKVGVKTSKRTNKIIANEEEQTSIENIFAIGDCVDGRPELTPPAIRAGKLLVKRLYLGSKEKMNYDLIPTTVFTPVNEYGSCGLSEEKAIEKYGRENIDVYHTEFVPVEWTFDHESEVEKTCYIKVIVNKKTDIVLGFHILSPFAGEITQGVVVAMKMGMKKKDLDNCIGIHPTIAEEMTLVNTNAKVGDGKKGGC